MTSVPEAVTELRVDFRTNPERYRHWRMSVDGPVARLEMDVAESGGLVPGYELKLNSYDLGVDIELYDAVQRLRFEHPEVKTVVLTSAKDKVFCAGANIRMLASSAHGWKVNFCKFTNETRNGIEDATENSGQTYLAAVNGTAAGRRLRAGAGVRAHHARRRSLVDGQPAGAAAARRAAGHRRADQGGGQAERAPRPGRLLRHQDGGAGRPQGGPVAAGGRGGTAAAVGRDGHGPRRRVRGAVGPRPATRPGSSSPRWTKPGPTRRSATSTSPRRSTRKGGSRRSPCGARRPARQTCTPRAPVSGPWPSPASWMT